VVCPHGPVDDDPPFVQAASAALASLFLAVVVLAVVAASAIAAKGRSPGALFGGVAGGDGPSSVSRRRGTNSASVQGMPLSSALSGLILWLVTGALLHQRVQSLLLRFDGARLLLPTAGRVMRRSAATRAAFLAISFSAHAFASRRRSHFRRSLCRSPMRSGNLALVNQGVSRFDASDVDVTALAVEARPARRPQLLTPRFANITLAPANT
jgi:hypothetical protein